MRFLFVISILLTSMQMASAEEEVLTPLQFQEGANAYEVEAISSGLSELIRDTFEHWFSESHFVYPPSCSSDVNDCRKNLDFEIDFETASFDLNNDGYNDAGELRSSIPGITEDQIAMIFNKYDTDMDGVLSLEEYLNLYNQKLKEKQGTEEQL